MSSPAPHQAIYRRWRAQTFSQIVGQEPVVETLRNAVRSGRVSHAILFVGPRGTGKTSLARILAKALNCTDLRDGDPCDACPSCLAIRDGRAFDLVEIDAASNRGIGDIRELRDRINYAPTDLRRKVYILDEAHQITREAWNALLKSLEEPPEFVVFIFASTHPQGFPPAILSRLQRYDVRALTVPEIRGKLERILAAEGVEAEPAAVELIARQAAGGMRDAESMLDQVLGSATGRIDEARVRELLGLADSAAVEGLLAALIDSDPIAGIAVLDELEDRGRDLAVVLDQLIDAIRAELTSGLDGVAEPARLAALAGVARWLATIDPERRGVGGLRLQVELALFSAAGRAPVAAPAPPVAAPTPPVAASAPPVAAPAPPVAADPPTTPPGVAVGPGPSLEPAPAGDAETTGPATPLAADRPGRPSEPIPVATAQPAADPRPAGEPSADLAALLRGWPEISASVRPATRAVIAECRPLAVDGNTVTLGFPEAKAFLKEIAERKRPDLESAVGTYLGRAVAVRCVATNIDLVPPPAVGEEAADFLAEARRIFADELVDVGEIS